MMYIHPHYINLVWLKITRPLYDTMGYFMARYWGIKIGSYCHFRGIPVFRNLPKSEINIGCHCTFNSSTTSNLIGVQTPCMFSTLKRGASIKIGDNCGFSGTVIWCSKSITLGENVRCGANTLIYDTDGHSDDPRAGMEKPIVIGNNVWLGYGVKVMKGVTIGENSLIGAGSIVTKDIPANVVAAGIPCKVIRKI